MITTFDLGAFLAADDKRAGAAELDRICRETGFVALVGHGVPDTIIADVSRMARAFFDLPLEEKLAVRGGPGKPYGYLPPDTEALAKSRGVDTPPDLKESFNGGPPAVPEGETDPDALKFYYKPTPFPARPDGFRHAWLAYYHELHGLAGRVLSAFAHALDLPPDHFDRMTDIPSSALRALNYPATSQPPAPGQQRAGAHSDYGSLTILLPEPGSTGLEIELQDGTWMPVDPIPGAFIVNIGDMMARWTNDRWRSTVHRVVADGSSARRMSLAFFHKPNWHAVIDNLTDEPSKYEPIRSGPYLISKFAAANA